MAASVLERYYARGICARIRSDITYRFIVVHRQRLASMSRN